MLETLSVRKWDESFADDVQEQALNKLENGQILHFPELAFELSQEEMRFLTPDYLDPHAKNIGYHQANQKLWGVQRLTDQQHAQLKRLMDRFAQHAHQLVKTLLPHYAEHLITCRTSFRPVQISNRKTSYRKDDTRLHVDAFPSAPNQGKRILRVFCNVNPHGEDRVWRIGESFENVAKQFLPKITKPLPGSAIFLRFLRITKSIRTLYDHYMLQIHDSMKADMHYQAKAEQQEVCFSPGSTWIVQTDEVSHAAMKGQYILEQTFYLPVSAMKDESKSPLRVLENLLERKLI